VLEAILQQPFELLENEEIKYLSFKTDRFTGCPYVRKASE
jgi:hypothetical protein